MKYTITEAVAGQTVTEFLRQTIGVSARDCQKLLRNKKVTVNGKAAHSKRILNVGDTVMVRRPAEHATLTTTANEPMPVVLYEDANTLVVSKPPFCQIHPTEHTKTGTLSHRIAAYYAKTKQTIPVRLVHRLDRDTSGCVLVAKTKEAQRYYTEQFQNGGVTKTYDGALVYCQIPTGRTHQIRLHMKSIGCPVLGDTMYGQAAPPFKRQCLHALRLTFVPYGQKEPVTVTSPLPNNFGINC